MERQMVELSPDQSRALDMMLDWYSRQPRTWVHCHGATDCPSHPHTHGSGRPAPVYALGGWAGSGKTTLMRMLDEELQGDAVFATPTHKAAGVLRKKLPGAQADRVRTYHSLCYQTTGIFRCTVSKNFVTPLKTKCVCGQEDACECPMHFLPCGGGSPHECHISQELKMEPRVHLGGHRDIIIIDESSMLSQQNVEDIRRFGVPILLVGDAGQLPPIKEPMNQWTMNPDIELTEIHRQGADSGILLAAHDVRRRGAMTQVAYGSPKPDAVRMLRTNPEVLSLLDRFNPSTDGALITYTNKMRAEFNRIYHARLVGEQRVGPGDRVVSLGGRPYEAHRADMTDDTVFRLRGETIQVHNGMTGTVLWANQRNIMTEMVVQLDDHRLATPDEPVIIYAGACPTAQFGSEIELPFNNPLRPRGSHLWDYAYALTAHKAQGSEFPKVIVVDQQPQNYRQWMYTAITRAQQAMIAIDWTR